MTRTHSRTHMQSPTSPWRMTMSPSSNSATVTRDARRCRSDRDTDLNRLACDSAATSLSCSSSTLPSLPLSFPLRPLVLRAVPAPAPVSSYSSSSPLLDFSKSREKARAAATAAAAAASASAAVLDARRDRGGDGDRDWPEVETERTPLPPPPPPPPPARAWCRNDMTLLPLARGDRAGVR